jgi:pentose-5-phosphate-3-epimerase
MLAGLAISPGTSVNDKIIDLLDRKMFDLVLVMTVGISTHIHY